MFKFLFISLYVLSFPPDEIQTCIKTNSNDSSRFTILYIFEGSDWCANCRRLDKQILSDTSLLLLLDSNNILIEKIDFPQRKKLSPGKVKYNAYMSEKLGFKGDFPTLVIYSKKSMKYTTLMYTNQDVYEFSRTLLHELKKLNE